MAMQEEVWWEILFPDQVARSVLFNNICNLVSLFMHVMFDYADKEDYDKQSKHKEQGMNRKKSDSDERVNSQRV